MKVEYMTKQEIYEQLHEMKIRGDGGDGVTNVFSDLDTLVTEGKRQKPISKKRMAEWIKMSPEKFCTDAEVSMERFLLNEKMVDLSKTPTDLVAKMIEQYNTKKKTPLGGWGNCILRYFMKHDMRVMTDSLQDFVCGARQKDNAENNRSLGDFF